MLKIHKLNHQEPFVLDGTWWRVGHARRKVTGKLHYDPIEGLHLEIDGQLRRPKEPWEHFTFPKYSETIFGVVENFTKVTLHNCYETELDPRSKYWVKVALLNAHANKLTALRFDSIFVSLTGLEEWVGTNPWEQDHTPKGEWIIKYTGPQPVTVDVPSEKFTLKIGYNVSSGGPTRSHSVQMNYTNSVLMYPRVRIGWKRFNNLTADIQRLFILLSGEANSIRQCGGIVFNRSHDGIRSVNSPQRFAHPDEVVYVFRKQVPQTEKREPFTNEMIMPLKVVGDRLDAVCMKWFRLARTLRPIFDVLFNELRTKSVFLEPQFFHIAQCLEAFHRSRIEGKGGRYVSKRRFRQIQKRVAASLPRLSPRLRPAIENAVWKANEVSFKERLKELFSKLNDETVNRLVKDRERFIDAVRDTRNLFTHLEKRKNSKAFHELQWGEAVDKILALMLIHLLLQCGFDESEIGKRMEHSRRFSGGAFEFIQDPDE